MITPGPEGPLVYSPVHGDSLRSECRCSPVHVPLDRTQLHMWGGGPVDKCSFGRWLSDLSL